ncbi:hypothetical protein [Desulfosporosinus sp. SB140]
MTGQEKSIIDSILADVGLESLHVGGEDEHESTLKLKPVIMSKTRY